MAWNKTYCNCILPAPVKNKLFCLVGAGGRSAMLNPFTNKNQLKKQQKNTPMSMVTH